MNRINYKINVNCDKNNQNVKEISKEESDRLLEECWNETVQTYSDVLTRLAK